MPHVLPRSLLRVLPRKCLAIGQVEALLGKPVREKLNRGKAHSIPIPLTAPLPRIAIRRTHHPMPTPLVTKGEVDDKVEGKSDVCAHPSRADSKEAPLDGATLDRLLEFGWCLSYSLSRVSRVNQQPRGLPALEVLGKVEANALRDKCRRNVSKELREEGGMAIARSLYWTYECTDWSWDPRAPSTLDRFLSPPLSLPRAATRSRARVPNTAAHAGLEKSRHSFEGLTAAQKRAAACSRRDGGCVHHTNVPK